MAKKKGTATQESIKASIPKLQSYKSWTGVNVKEAPLGWNPDTDDTPGQGELMSNFLMVQNNAITTSSRSIETRFDEEVIATAPSGTRFTGVSCLVGSRIFCAFDDKNIRYHDLGDDPSSWTLVPYEDPNFQSFTEWTDISRFQDQLICMHSNSVVFSGSLSTIDTKGVSASKYLFDPEEAPSVTVFGNLKESDESGSVARLSICWTMTNRSGTTLPSPWKTVEVNMSPVEWNSNDYMVIWGSVPENARNEATGIDLYCAMNDNTDPIFIGHVNLWVDEPFTQVNWAYAWFGSMSDTSQWTNVSLSLPTENTTRGPNASFCTNHDGRLYFFGGNQDKSRLYIGGNPGNELSVARGLGGGFVDIDPGSGLEINGTAKFKTYNGSSIVTIMCGNENTGNVKRFNLLETNVTITNELSAKGYMTEEVSNVIGCNGRWGFGVFADGLYAVSRYGLAVTTQVMESNNQLKAQYLSDAVQPLFTETLAYNTKDANMVFIDGVIYIALSNDEGYLDNLIMCYDIDQKSWYTFTHAPDRNIKRLVSIDSEEHWEGLGIIDESSITMIPTTGSMPSNKPDFEVSIETGELTARDPAQYYIWLSQVELDFDWIVGDVEIVIEGWDYYGRRFQAIKEVSVPTLARQYPVWIRVDKMVESWRMRIKGKARFRLTHFLAKVYQQSYSIDLVYGYDSKVRYTDAHGNEGIDRHCLEEYNNLRRAVVP